MATLHELISSIRLEIADRTGTQWQEDELIRAIDKTVSLMSRLAPRRDLVEDAVEAAWIKGSYLLDISSFLPDYIKIERIEYPADESPPSILTADVIGKYIMFRTNPSLTAGETIRITYLGKWTPPTPIAAGNYPSHLNDIVIIGAAGQALIYKAESIVQLASQAFESLVAPTAYTFVKPTAPELPAVPTKPTAPTLSFTAAESAMTAIATEISAAKSYLATGDPLINKVTVGDKVGEIYGLYGNVLMTGAGHRSDEAAVRIKQIESIINKYASEVTAFGSETNSYANNVSALVSLFRSKGETENIGANVYASEVNAYVARINGQKAKADSLLDIAGRYLASGQSKINEFLSALGYKAEFSTQRAAAEQRS